MYIRICGSSFLFLYKNGNCLTCWYDNSSPKQQVNFHWLLLLMNVAFVLEHINYSLVCHSREPVFMEQIDIPKETIAEVLLNLVTAAGSPSLVSMT